jgi:beta-glucosidase-like glycosyl hydrolase
LIPRLNGTEIEEKFDQYLGLVNKGVAGFILFGGEIESARIKIAELRDRAKRPFIIASDLEQGVGQQLTGGTLFPPALAVAAAMKTLGRRTAHTLLRKLYTAVALEARYAGINTIFAPVLDINSNPKNPIIATRAFGEDSETVSFFGCEMIKTLQQNGITACGKHFPGHGDTEDDSHITLPVIYKSLQDIERHELVPFRKAIDVGVGMIMLGHLCVPAIDPLGIPASLSRKANSYLRRTLGFRGITITDAMNMGAIDGCHEDESSRRALEAGVDLILHPTDPDKLASYFREKRCDFGPLNHPACVTNQDYASVDFKEHRRLSRELTEMSVTVVGEKESKIRKPFLILLNEDRGEKKLPFINAFRKFYPGICFCMLLPEEEIPWELIPKGSELIIGVFSAVKAWKGGATRWLQKSIQNLNDKATVFVSFGNPFPLRDVRKDVIKVFAYWDSEMAQEAAAEKLLRQLSQRTTR